MSTNLKVGSTSSCVNYRCPPCYEEYYGPYREERFRIFQVVNGRNNNVKSGNPVALESIYRPSQYFDCRKGKYTLTSFNTGRSSTAAPVNITQQILY